jgi:putative tryptophan/tyrosine transport system substrate-binding protein
MIKGSITLIASLALAILLAPLAAEAQAGKVPRVGVLYCCPRDTRAHIEKWFEDRLGELGYVKDRNIVLVHRYADGTVQGIGAAAQTLVAIPVDVLVTWSGVGAAAAKKTTSVIPIVFLAGGNPLATGLVQNLHRPGGNVTGVAFEAALETNAKRLGMLKEAIPKLSRVAVLLVTGDPNVGPTMEALNLTAPSLGVQLQPVRILQATDLDAAFADMQKQGAQAVFVLVGALTWTQQQRIAELALMHRLPSSWGWKESVEAGGLVAVAPSLFEIARQGAVKVDQILRGAKPGDLPVELPMRYEVHVNLKTAKALGLTLPPSLLLQADSVVE